MGAGQLTKIRKGPSLTFTAFSDIQRQDIRGNLPLRGISLYASGTVTVASGSTDGTANTDQPHGYVGPIKVDEQGGPNLVKVNGAELADLMQNYFGVRPYGSALSASTGTAKPWAAHFYIPFSLPARASASPDDTIYDAEGKTINVEVQLGGALTNGGGTGGFFQADNDRTNTFVTGGVTIELHEVQGMPPPKPGQPRGKWLPLIEGSRDANLATQSRFQKRLPLGRLYRTLLIKTLGAVTSGNISFNPSASILNNVEIYGGDAMDRQSAVGHWRGNTLLESQADTERAGVYVHNFVGEPHQILEGRTPVGDWNAWLDITKPSNNCDIVTVLHTAQLLAA